MTFIPAVYAGPKADIASVTGSPLWGVSVDDVIKHYQNLGWKVLQKTRPVTPYGQGQDALGSETVLFQTAKGRRVIWIPSYGGVLGQDWSYHNTREKLYWILWQAGVKVLIVGGTSGITDWRLYTNSCHPENLVEPGDMVFPWSFMTHSSHRGLPGTELETAWPRYDMTLDSPFCPELAQIMASKAEEYIASGKIRRVHTAKDIRVALVIPQGITFETDFEILDWATRCRAMSELSPKQPPIVTLHGDCLAPVFCRLAGIHLAYYHLVANRAQGMPQNPELVATLHKLYCGKFRNVALEFEPWLLENMPIPEGGNCLCISSKHEAPQVFSEAMTQPK